MPLSVIKKILKNHKKKTKSEQSTLQIQSKYFKPIDQLLSGDSVEKEEFIEISGLSEYWLNQMEEWQVIKSEKKKTGTFYSRDDVIIGKLIKDMDKYGFGTKNGHDPEDLRRFVFFFREVIVDGLKAYLKNNIDRIKVDYDGKYSQFTELMSLFFYHSYRKLVKEEIKKKLINT